MQPVLEFRTYIGIFHYNCIGDVVDDECSSHQTQIFSATFNEATILNDVIITDPIYIDLLLIG